MMEKISVSNIKCGGCANSIINSISKISGVSNVKVNVDEGFITWSSSIENSFDLIKKRLATLGYPEGDSTMTQTAKSYVSCAIGRISSKN